jgi:hypothetical protein
MSDRVRASQERGLLWHRDTALATVADPAGAQFKLCTHPQ